jgi:hypothetical protein
MCRQVAPSLYAIAGITPEVIDVWDSIAVRNPFFPDIPNKDRAYFQDNELLFASDTWDDPLSQNYQRPRSACTEMSRLRRRRQKQNVRRRAIAEETLPLLTPRHVMFPRPQSAGSSADNTAGGGHVIPES